MPSSTLDRFAVANPGLSIWIDGSEYQFPKMKPPADLVARLHQHIGMPCQVSTVKDAFLWLQFKDCDIVIH